jgi:hypothetical protein
LIVLLSGELSYLDEHSLSLFDFKLPLPILKDSIARFSDWFLQQKINKKRTRVNSSRESENASTVSMSTFPNNNSIQAKRRTMKLVDSKKKLVTLQKLLTDFITGYFYIGSEKFQWNSVETYFKWRLLNPTNSIAFHNTQLMFFYSFLVLFRIVLVLYIGTAPRSLRSLLLDFVAVIPLLFFSSKEYFYKYIFTQSKITVVKLLSIVSVVGVLIFQFRLYQPILHECRVVEDSHYVPAGRPLNETLLACKSDGYVMMRYILSGTPFFFRWSTWPFPR